jgi:hypothetical protein
MLQLKSWLAMCGDNAVWPVFVIAEGPRPHG